MSSKDPDEVDQTWQVQEIAQCGEKDVAAAAKKARGTQRKMHIEMSLAFGLPKPFRLEADRKAHGSHTLELTAKFPMVTKQILHDPKILTSSA